VTEEDVDRDFFVDSKKVLGKLKLNKGEKRVLKFILKREMSQGGEDPSDIDILKFIQSQGNDVN